MAYPNPPQYPAQPPLPYQPQPQPQRSAANPVLIGVATGLGIIFVALVVVLIVVFVGNNKEKTDAAAQKAPEATPAATSTVTVSPAPTVTVTRAPNQTENVEPAHQTPWPPANATTLCDSRIAVNSVTSCEFAQMVADAVWDYGPNTYNVYSPVTDRMYDMNCRIYQGNIYICTGGNNALVYVKDY